MQFGTVLGERLPRYPSGYHKQSVQLVIAPHEQVLAHVILSQELLPFPSLPCLSLLKVVLRSCV